MPDKTTLSRYAPWLLMAVLPLCVHLPALTGWLRFDPLYVVSGVTDGTWTTNGLIGGRPGWVDANAGVTTEALGALAARDWLHGILPYWNPFSGVGMPLAGEGQTTAFFLPFGLLLALPHGLLALRILLMTLAGIFALALLRHMRLGRLPATVGAALLQLNGVFAWMAHGPMMPVAFLPLLLLGIERARAQSGFPWAIVLGTAWSLSAGFPETAFLDGLLAAAWAALRLCQSSSRAGFAARVGGGGLLGALIATPALWPFLQGLPDAFIGEHAHIMKWAFLPANWALLLFPYLFGNIHYTTASMPQPLDIWARTGGYCDIVLVVLGLLGVRRTRPETALRWLLLGWILLFLARAFGVPGITGALASLPLLRQTMLHVYVLPSWCMALSLLAAFALDDWRNHAAGRILPVAALSALGTLACLFVGGGQIAALWHLLATYPAYPVLSLAEAALVLAVVFTLWRRLPTPRNAAALALVVMGQAAGLFTLPLLAGTRGRRIDDASVAYLQAHAGLGRVMSFGPLVPNYGAFFGVAELGYNALPVPRNWVDYARTHFQAGANGVILHEGDAPPRNRLGSLIPAYEAAGVATIVTWPGETPFAPGTATRVHQGQVMDIWSLPDPAAYASAPGCRVSLISRTHILADCRAPSTLIRRELAAPGWEARLDGVPQPIEGAGEIFQSVALPSGRSDILFSYGPPGMKWAWLACGLGGLSCLAWRAGEKAAMRNRSGTAERAQDKLWNPIDVTDIQAANDWLLAEQKAWFDALPKSGKSALDDFKGPAGLPINQFLRGESDDARATASVAALQLALADADAPADMLLHRGVGAKEAAHYRSLAPGSVTRATCFMATSLLPDIARAVAARQPGGTTIELVVHKGQKGVAYVHPFPTYRYRQWEVLINAGTGLRVLGTDDQSIRLEVVNVDKVE